MKKTKFIEIVKDEYKKALPEAFTATNKKTGNTSVFKSKEARDAAVKAGTHDKIKDTDSKSKGKSDVNIFEPQIPTPKDTKFKLVKPPKDAKQYTEPQVSAQLDKLAAMAKQAKEKGEQAPDFDLCQVSIPGTNLFCAGNKGIPRAEMPQLKGKPAPNTLAAKIAAKTGDESVDGEKYFIKSLKNNGVKMVPKKVNADTLKSTQSQLVGTKVASMAKALETLPPEQTKGITAPIFVSRDGYVLDGHHRWAAQVGFGIDSGKPVMMDVIEVDMSINDLVDFSNDFATKFGIAQKAGKVKESINNQVLNILIEQELKKFMNENKQMDNLRFQKHVKAVKSLYGTKPNLKNVKKYLDMAQSKGSDKSTLARVWGHFGGKRDVKGFEKALNMESVNEAPIKSKKGVELTYKQAISTKDIDHAIENHIKTKYPNDYNPGVSRFHGGGKVGMLGKQGHNLKPANIITIAKFAKQNNDKDLLKLIDKWISTAKANDIIESVNEAIEPQTKKIAALTGTRPEAVKHFVSMYGLNITKLLKFLEKAKLSDRMDFVTAITGKPGNKYQGEFVGNFGESVNEAYKIGDFPIGAKILFKDGEEWKVIKKGMRGSGEQRKNDEITIIPSNTKAKSKNINKPIDIDLDYLNKNVKTIVKESVNEAKVNKRDITKATKLFGYNSMSADNLTKNASKLGMKGKITMIDINKGFLEIGYSLHADRTKIIKALESIGYTFKGEARRAGYNLLYFDNSVSESVNEATDTNSLKKIHDGIFKFLKTKKGVGEVKEFPEFPNRYGDNVSTFSVKYNIEDRYNYDLQEIKIEYSTSRVFIPNKGYFAFKTFNDIKNIINKKSSLKEASFHALNYQLDESVTEANWAHSKGGQIEVGNDYRYSKGKKPTTIKIKKIDPKKGVTYYDFSTREYITIPVSTWNNTKAGHYMTPIKESINEETFGVPALQRYFKQNPVKGWIFDEGFRSGYAVKFDSDNRQQKGSRGKYEFTVEVKSGRWVLEGPDDLFVKGTWNTMIDIEYILSKLAKKYKVNESINEVTYKVAGKSVTLNKGKKEDGTDWTVTFKNGKTVPLSDTLALIKPFPPIKESVNEGLSKAEYTTMIKMLKKSGAKGFDIIKSLASDTSTSTDKVVSDLEKYQLIQLTEATVNIKAFGDTTTLDIKTYKDKTGHPYVSLYENGEPYADITVVLPETKDLPKDEFFAKGWSENKEIVIQLIKNKVLIPTGKTAKTGFVEAHSFKLSPKYK